MDLAALAPILIALLISVTAVRSQITRGPMNALKKVNDSVTLDCVTSSKNCDQVEWVKMEVAQSARTVYKNGVILNDFRGRFSVSSTGGCSLTIVQLQISDSGGFTCTQLVNESEEKKSCVLVVISVSESCQSNLLGNALKETDGYSFTTAINVPAKSVEQSYITLSYLNKSDYERLGNDESWQKIVKTTLVGFARKENIGQRVCRASLLPNRADGFDRSTATLDVCTTKQLFVSYPVENIDVSYEDVITKESSPSPTGSYYKGATVRCTADGYPNPSFKWTHLKSGADADGDTLVIDGETGDEYTCTATNTVNGKTTSLNKTIEVVSPPEQPDPGCGPICIGVIVGGVVLAIVAIVIIVFIVFKRKTDK